MKIIIALLLFFSCSQASGQNLVFKNDRGDGKRMALRLYQTPCADAEVIKNLIPKVSPEWLLKFKTERLTWDGKDWESCWLEVNGVVYSIDSEGAQLQPIPKSLFVDEMV